MTITASEIARMMEAMRTRTPRECPECGEVRPMLANQKRCSESCRKKPQYRRRKARKAAKVAHC